MPKWFCPFVWFIIPLKLRVNGSGASFFSNTAPTVQLESIIPVRKDNIDIKHDNN